MTFRIARAVARVIAGNILRRRKGPFVDPYGPELITTPVGTGWISSQPSAVINANSITFTGAVSNDNAYLPVTLKDNTTYRVEIRTIAISSGAVRGRVYGATTGHSGIFVTGKTTVGVFVEEVTTNGAGSVTNRATIQASNGSFTVNYMSVREKLDLTSPAHLLDESGAFLTDENGNQLTMLPT
jgi:hypothetical protein